MTRAQFRVLLAYSRIRIATAGRLPSSLARWLEVRWNVREITALDAAQARHAARQLNAWAYHEQPDLRIALRNRQKGAAA